MKRNLRTYTCLLLLLLLLLLAAVRLLTAVDIRQHVTDS